MVWWSDFRGYTDFALGVLDPGQNRGLQERRLLIRAATATAQADLETCFSGGAGHSYPAARPPSVEALHDGAAATLGRSPDQRCLFIPGLRRHSRGSDLYPKASGHLVVDREAQMPPRTWLLSLSPSQAPVSGESPAPHPACLVGDMVVAGCPSRLVGGDVGGVSHGSESHRVLTLTAGGSGFTALNPGQEASSLGCRTVGQSHGQVNPDLS